MTNTTEEAQKNIFTALQEKYEVLGDELIDTVFSENQKILKNSVESYRWDNNIGFSENQKILKKGIVRSREFKKIAFLTLLKLGGPHAGDLLTILEDDLIMDDKISPLQILDREKLTDLCKTLIEEDKEIRY
jgi:hypothetical protein